MTASGKEQISDEEWQRRLFSVSAREFPAYAALNAAVRVQRLK